jgi:hypothetical protein
LISEYLRNSAPADIPDEDVLLVFGCFAAFRAESMDQLDCREVVPALLFQRTLTERILRADAIAVCI